MSEQSKPKLQEWEDVGNAIKQAKKDDKDVSLFLGNGFNLALGINASYEALFKDCKKLNALLQTLFNDYEALISKEKYNYKLEVFLQDKMDEVVEVFYSEILSKCEDGIEEKRLKSVVEFLKKFKNYFSTNYDPLLYKIFMSDEVLREQHHRDGFGGSGLKWSPTKEQKFFYLHGGLHICWKDDEGDESDKIIKITQTKENKLIPNIQDSLKNRRHFCVFSKYSRDKKDKIEGNEYLKFCLEKLRKLEGVLVIYGWSASKGDQHLIDAIVSSPVDQIYISQHENQNASNYDWLKKSCQAKGKKVNAFCAKTVPFYIKKEDNAPSH